MYLERLIGNMLTWKKMTNRGPSPIVSPFAVSCSMRTPAHRLAVLRGLTSLAVSQQGFLDMAQHAAARKNAPVVCKARHHSGEQFQAFGHMLRRMDMKQALADRFDYLVVEHQMATVAMRNQHALAAVQSGSSADVEIAFDFFIDAAYREHIAVQVERAGHSDALLERQSG